MILIRSFFVKSPKRCDLSMDDERSSLAHRHVKAILEMIIHCSHGFSIQDGITQVMKYGLFIGVMS